MDLFNRLVVTLLAALLTAGGIVALALVSGWPGDAALQQAPGLIPLATWLHGLPAQSSLWAAGIGGGSAVIGAALLFAELRAPAQSRGIVIHRDKNGQVTVAMTGLRRLADHVAGEIPGVQAVSSEARAGRQGVAFRCRVLVSPDAATPEVSEELRKRLTAAVGSHLGAAAGTARIDVQANIGSPAGLTRRVR